MNSWLKVKPAEYRSTSILFLQLFASSAIFVLGRTLRDTLFLSRYSVAALPWMFVCYGIASALVILIYGRFADRLDRPKLLHWTCSLGIATYLAIWVLVRLRTGWIYPVFYVWAEIVSNLLILQFWTLAADLEDPRSARRLNPLIGSARPLGTIFFGFITGWIVRAIGTEQIFLILMILMVLVAVCVSKLRSFEPAHTPAETSPSLQDLKEVGIDPYFRSLAALALAMFVALTIGDYQFKVIASAHYREDDLARFFSLFYGIVGVVAFLFQLLITPRIFSRLGVGSALTVMPGVFGTFSLALIAWPGLAAACAMKFSDNGLQYTLHDTTMQSLYAPFPAQRRARSRGFLEGAIKPLSYGAGGLLVLSMVWANFDVREMSVVCVILALIWQGLIPLVRIRYLRALERGLAGPMAAQLFSDPLVLGGAERRLLVHALSSAVPTRALVALEQLEDDSSPEFRAALVQMLGRPEPALRQRALERLEALADAVRVPEFRASAADPEPMVRAAAVRALARFTADESPQELLDFIEDPSQEVRAEALSGLLKFGDIEGRAHASEHLLRMIGSEDLLIRREACGILARLGRDAYLSLKKLMHDPSPRVRRAALRAAGSVADARLLPFLVEALKDPALCRTALAALASVGEAAVESIDRALRDPSLPRTVLLEMPRVLRQIRSHRALVVLEEHQVSADSHLRLRIFAALGRLRRVLGRSPYSAEAILPRVHAEVVEAWNNRLGWSHARWRFDSPLLAEEMGFRLQRAERRIIRLLQLCYNWKELEMVLQGLADPRRRAQALETLDAMLSSRLRREVIPFLEDGPSSDRPTELNDPSICILPPADFIRSQVHHPNPYVALLALDALARAGETSAIPDARQAATHHDPLVRESAIRALAALAPEEFSRDLARVLNDPDPAVARFGRYLQSIKPSQDQHPWEKSMYGTIERILFLKSTPLFSSLPGEDLATLARAAEMVSFAADELIFREGTVSDHFYVIVSGTVLLESGGRELRRTGPPNVIGELSVLDGAPRTASARALEPTELLRIGREEFFEILHEQSEIAEALIKLLAAQLREAHIQLMKTP